MSPRKADFLRFGAFGMATFGLVFWIQVSWLRIVAWLMGRDSIIFGQQPEWSRILASAVGVISWIIGVVLVVVAILRRRWVPLLAFVGPYFLGIALFLFVLFGTPVVQDYASRTSGGRPRTEGEQRVSESEWSMISCCDTGSLACHAHNSRTSSVCHLRATSSVFTTTSTGLDPERVHSRSTQSGS
jgi:hypothetical protein